MPVIAIVNRKGGSGKSTVATHIATYFAQKKFPVMLGDVDRQQSARSWLIKRNSQMRPLIHINGWAINQINSVRTPPSGVSHVVLDTGGGLHGLDLARVIMFADLVILPTGYSLFDRESTAACLLELKKLSRVQVGRCRLAVVGTRIPTAEKQKIDQRLRFWAKNIDVDYVASISDSALYVQHTDQGLTLFDTPTPATEELLKEWDTLFKWISDLLHPQQYPSVVAERLNLASNAKQSQTTTLLR